MLLAILIYVSLDLSLASMPGAFVFEPAESVESTQIGRGRVAADATLPPVREPATAMVQQAADAPVRRLPVIASAHRARQRPARQPSPVREFAPPAEDPH